MRFRKLLKPGLWVDFWEVTSAGGGEGGVFFAFFGSYVVDWVDVMGWLPGVFCAFFACFCALFYAFGGAFGRDRGRCRSRCARSGCPGLFWMTGCIVRFLGIIIGKGTGGSGSFLGGGTGGVGVGWGWECLLYRGRVYAVKVRRRCSPLLDGRPWDGRSEWVARLDWWVWLGVVGGRRGARRGCGSLGMTLPCFARCARLGLPAFCGVGVVGVVGGCNTKPLQLWAERVGEEWSGLGDDFRTFWEVGSGR